MSSKWPIATNRMLFGLRTCLSIIVIPLHSILLPSPVCPPPKKIGGVGAHFIAYALPRRGGATRTPVTRLSTGVCGISTAAHAPIARDAPAAATGETTHRHTLNISLTDHDNKLSLIETSSHPPPHAAIGGFKGGKGAIPASPSTWPPTSSRRGYLAILECKKTFQRPGPVGPSAYCWVFVS